MKGETHMHRPHNKRPMTVELASEWISYYEDIIDVLKNHCTITESDSLTEMVFKSYAINQNVKLVEHDLKSYGQNIKTPEISQICRKETISDKKLEYFVKSVATAGKKYSTYHS